MAGAPKVWLVEQIRREQFMNFNMTPDNPTALWIVLITMLMTWLVSSWQESRNPYAEVDAGSGLTVDGEE